jgi:endo-1,4-beta-xylanase
MDQPHQNAYLRIISDLIEAGAPLDGIGMQGHFGWYLTPPARVIEILDRFGATSKDLQITEFDVDVSDLQLQADYTRDFLTAVFSHPAIKGFLMWGFWEGRHWKPQAAMYRRDWTPKPNADAFNDLVFHKWWTNADGYTDDGGQYTVRGFLGEYEVQVLYGETSITLPARLDSGGRTLDVTVP